MVQILEKASFDSCEVILVGSAACNTLYRKTNPSSRYIEFQNSAVVWEFLKGRILPGIAALDKVSHALEQLLCSVVSSSAHKILDSHKQNIVSIHTCYHSICDKWSSLQIAPKLKCRLMPWCSQQASTYVRAYTILFILPYFGGVNILVWIADGKISNWTGLLSD